MPKLSSNVLNFRAQARELCKVPNLTICGLFIALYLVLSSFNIRLSSFLEIRFAFLALAAAGMYGGPVMGISVGALSDIVSAVVSGQPYFPGFTFSYALLGMLFGLTFYRSHPTIGRCIAAGLCEALVSLFLHTYWLHLLYGMPLAALFVSRIVKCGVLFFANCILLTIVLRAFARVLGVLRLSVQN